MNNVMSLEAVQTELIREILNVNDVLVLEKIKRMLRWEERNAEQGTMCVAEEEVPEIKLLTIYDRSERENLTDKELLDLMIKNGL